MSKLIELLYLSIFLVQVNSGTYLNRPKIKTSNGDLILKPAYGKNIYLRSNGPKSAIYVDDLNILTINSSQAIEEDGSSNVQRPAIEEILTRLENLEKQPNYSNLDLSYNITHVQRRLDRMTASINHFRVLMRRGLFDDKCEIKPCQNGGTCLSLVNDYHCLCPSTWEGKNCDEDVNECRNFAGTDLGCQNGATCINKPGSYECLCRNGWFGLHCTRKAKDCSGGNFEMCGHGICVTVTTGSGIQCICDQGWTNNGTDVACLTDINECESNQAPHCSINPKVNCINLPGSFRCESCPAGYEGDGFICKDIDECTTLPNGGCSTTPMVSCHNTLGSRVCGRCPAGYIGDGVNCEWSGRCNEKFGGCHPSAQCIAIPGHIAQCVCPSGMEGNGVGIYGCYIPVPSNNTEHCTANDPCGAHGRCHQHEKGYVCICEKDYGGAHCDTTMDYCSSNPCLNGGVCRSDDTTSRGYRCECTARFSGELCQLPAKSCGGLLTAQEGSIVYPLTNNSNYNHNSRCAWVIQTTTNKVINVTFTKFDVEKHPDCAYDFLQIHDGRSSASQLIGRFCGNYLPKGGNIVSSHNYLYFWFRSDGSLSKGGFALHWVTINPFCGGKVDAKTHGHISSPGSPGKYPPNRDCYWHLSTKMGKRIQLHFYELDIEAHKNCSFDYLAIYDGEHTSDPLISKYCNASQPAPVQSAGSEMLIHFHSDAFDSGNGFQISYATIEGIPGCGGYYTEDIGEISSPTYNGKYLNNQICDYKIKTAPGTRIILRFEKFQLETSFECKFDFLKIYDGDSENSRLVGSFCGSVHPKVYTSSSNTLFIKFQSDNSLSKDGFKLNYRTICMELISGDSGVIKSPGYPFNYTNNKLCEYIISTTPGKAIELKFQEFDVEDSKFYDCRYDNVEVRDGPDAKSNLLGRFCGANIPPLLTSTLNYMYVRFQSDLSIGGTGFYGNYTTIDTKCGGIHKETTGLINLPTDASGRYENDQLCTWYLIAPPGQHIKLTWNRFELESSHKDCEGDYLEISERDQDGKVYSMPKFCGSKRPPTMITSTNSINITFKSDHTVATAGFSLSYTFLDEKTHCGGICYRTHGTIVSPGWPNIYEPKRDCVWTISVPFGQQIKLNISLFDLESPVRNKCDLGDFLEIRNGATDNSPLVGKYCGTSIPKFITSTGNTMYIRFYSDFYLSGKGFQLEWDGTLRGCGGTLTGSTGSITSPNYPQNYGENAECFYKIITSQGSRVKIIFNDLELEDTHHCSDDYVEVFDGRDGNSPSLGKHCTMTTAITNIETSTNYAFIKFRSDFLIGGKGFSLSYHTICQNNITGSYGIIESPDFPNNYPMHLNCKWTINVPLGNTINITFTNFNIYKRFVFSYRFRYRNDLMIRNTSDLNELIPCRQDYLQVIQRTESTSRLCGSTLPAKISSRDNSITIEFVTRAFMSRSGFRLEWVKQGCGGHIQRRFGIVKFEAPSRNSGPIECEWIIETPPGTGVTILFTFAYMENTPNCSTDAVEAYNGPTVDAPLLMKSCDSHFSMAEASTTNIVLLRFVKHSYLQDVKFIAQFSSKPSSCGGRITSRLGTISSINYPKDYENNMDCIWTIEVPKYHRIEFNIMDLDLYTAFNVKKNGSNCEDFIKIYDSGVSVMSNASQLICANTNTTRFISKSNFMNVQFVTNDYGTAKGFNANFTAICGGVIDVKDVGTLEHDNFITHSNSCVWTISADELDQKITLTLTHISLPVSDNIDSNKHCSSTYLRVLDGNDINAPIIGEYCGRKIPPMIVSRGSAITIQLGSNNGVINGTFSAHYSAVATACGGELTSEEGSIASPNYPNSYPPNSNCEWILKTSPGNRLYITFEKLDLKLSEGCNGDYIELRENNPGGHLLGLYCGNDIPVNVTVASQIYIKFHSDNQESKQGFLLHYEFLHGNDIGSNDGVVASPLYPKLYVGRAEYTWRITTSGSEPIILTIEQLEIPVRGSDCYNHLAIYDGFDTEAPLLKQLCGLIKFEKTEIQTSSNIVLIKLKLDETNTGSIFYLRWRQIDNSPTETDVNNVKVNCGSNGTIFIPAGDNYYVKSPKYPENYDNELNCEWIFKASPNRHLTLQFTDITIEQQPTCFADHISVYSSDDSENWKLLKDKICTSQLLPTEFTASSYIKLVFVSDETITSKGFAATVKSACGGFIRNTSGVIGPTLQDWGNVYYTMHCNWTVKVRPGHTIRLNLEHFNGTNVNDHCENFVMLHNGDSNEAPLLAKYCGYPNEVKTAKSTSSNYLFISSQFRGSRSLVTRDFRNFRVRYEEENVECGAVLTLDSSHTFETINSPNFPSVPTPYSECGWLVTGPPGEVLRIDFIDRFDLERNSDCTEEYVEIRDGSSALAPLKGRYCDERPGTIKTSSNVVYIKYITQLQNPRDGFKANISIDVCGGTVITNNGYITSPGYPHMPVLSDGTVCEWKIIGYSGRVFNIQPRDFDLPHSDEPCAFKVTIEETHKNNISRIVKTLCSDNTDGNILKNIETSSNTITIKLYIGKASKWKATTDYHGFRFNFNSSRPYCGGSVTASEGFITTPGYPLQTTLRYCQWLITAPDSSRSLRLELVDADLGAGKISVFNDIGFTTNIKNSSNIYESSGNQLAVYIWMTQTTTEYRFKAKFTSNEPALCGGALTGTSGGLLSPSLNRSSICKWHYINEQNTDTVNNNTIFLDVAVNSSVKSSRCRFSDPKLMIKTTVESSWTFVRQICGVKTTSYRIPASNMELTSFRDSSHALDFNVKWKIYPCGGVVHVNENRVNIINVPTNYTGPIECAWALAVPFDTRIELQLEGSFKSECSKEYLQISQGLTDNPVIVQEYCKDKTSPSTLTMKFNFILVQYHADHFIPNINLTVKTMNNVCGGILTKYDNTFMSPNFPNPYKENEECVWEIRADLGSRVSLQFVERFVVEQRPNCTKDAVIIYDWKNEEYIQMAKLCGRELPSVYNSTSNRMKVVLRTDADINLDGFKALWTHTCGGTFNATHEEQFLYSPGYPSEYYPDLNCVYIISAPEQKIVIKYEDLEIEGPYPNCNFDNLSVTGYTSEQIFDFVTICGLHTKAPEVYSDMVTFNFVTDRYIQKRGFKISYQLYSCGGEIKSPTVLSSQEKFQTTYEANMNCTWSIEAPANKVVVMKFLFVDLETSADCSTDFLAVYNGLKIDEDQRVALLCGHVNSTTVLRSTGNNMLLNFITDFAVGYSGFKAEITFSYDSAVGCGGEIDLTKTSTYILKSPLIGNDVLYKEFLDCHWRVRSPSDKVIQIQFISFHISPCRNVNQTAIGYSKCDCDKVEIRDGINPNSILIGTYCGHTLPPKLTSSGHLMGIALSTDGEIESSGFEARLSLQNSVCGQTTYRLNHSVQHIKTPGYDTGTIPRGEHCSYTINSGSQYFTAHIRINNIDLQEGALDKKICDRDKLIITNTPGDHNTSLGRNFVLSFGSSEDFFSNYFSESRIMNLPQHFEFCGVQESIDLYVAGRLHINVQTSAVSDSLNHRGVDIEVTYASFCPRNYTETQGRISIYPTFASSDDSEYDSPKECFTLITAPENHTISVYFFTVSPIYWNDNVYLEVFDGDKMSSNRLIRIGSDFEDNTPVFSNGRYLLLHNHGTEGDVITFDMNYVTTDKGRGCGGKLQNLLGQVTSPLYPAVYRRIATCEWELETPIGTNLRLHFMVFDLGKLCEQNYLQLVNRAGQVMSTFCSETPADYTSEDNYVKIVFTTTKNNSGTGWVARFVGLAG